MVPLYAKMTIDQTREDIKIVYVNDDPSTGVRRI